MAYQGRCIRQEVGLTLIEGVVLLVIVAVLALVFLPKLSSSSAIAIGPQAQSVAADLRKAQTFAMSFGRSICFKRVSSTEYSLFETTLASGVTECANVKLIDPLTGREITRTIGQGISLSGDATVIFNSLGKALAGATLYLSSDDQYRPVAVEALSGLVTIGTRNLALPAPQAPAL